MLSPVHANDVISTGLGHKDTATPAYGVITPDISRRTPACCSDVTRAAPMRGAGQ